MRMVMGITLCGLLAGLAGCGINDRTRVVERKTEIDRDDGDTTVKTKTKTETIRDDGTVEETEVESKKKVEVKHVDDDDDLIKIGPLEIKEP